MFFYCFMIRTLSIIKPDATRRNLTGAINKMIEEKGFTIIAQKRIWLTLRQAQQFYKEHEGKGFFAEMTEVIASYPCVVQVLQKENAILDYRTLMGATDPQKADAGTIRASYAISIGENSVHGSDSETSAQREIGFFFSEIELVG